MTHLDPTTVALSRTLLLCRDEEVVGTNRPSDDALVKAFAETRVLLVADERNLAAPSGQHAMVGLVNQVGRLGVDLKLAMPEVPVIGSQPPLRGVRLRSGLLNLSLDLIPGRCMIETDPSEPADIVIILGDSDWHGSAPHAIRMVGDDWSGGIVPAEVPAGRWTSSFPIGGLIAAGVATPEPFKSTLRALARMLPQPVPTDYLEAVTRATVRLAPEGTPTGSYALGDVDLISGGAIANSALLPLLHLPDARAHVRIIEPEVLDLSNLNRYGLARCSDVGRRKTALLGAYSHRDFTITGIDAPYNVDTALELGPLAPRVLVGTDDIPSRWTVQRAWPEWMAVGATSHFIAIASAHRPGEACAGCVHPRDDPDPRRIPTVSFVSAWAGLLLAVRLMRSASEHGSLLGQQTYCAPLRFDSATAVLQMGVTRRSDCPVRCSATRVMVA